jgi:hypothetical protein
LPFLTPIATGFLFVISGFYKTISAEDTISCDSMYKRHISHG